jgi:hypothetical protein
MFGVFGRPITGNQCPVAPDRGSVLIYILPLRRWVERLEFAFACNPDRF